MVLNYITWNVDPVAFTLGPFSVRWYGICWALGFLFGYILMSQVYKKENMPKGEMDALLLTMLISTVIGARLGHCLFYEPDVYLPHPISILYIWEGGLSSHGGAFGILIGLWIYVRIFNKKTKQKGERSHITYLWILDRIVIPVCLVGSFIRMGNLFNSEIYGKPTTLPWGFVFVQGAYKFYGENGELLPCHPTAIYEILFCLIAMGILLWMCFKRNTGDKYPGLMFGTFLVIVFGSRIAIEFVKNAQVAIENNWLFDIGQWLSVPFVIVGIVMIVRAFLKKNKNVQQA